MYLFRVFQHLLRIQLTRSGSWVVLSLLLDSPPSDLAICPKTFMGSFSTPGCTPGWQMASSWCVCLVCFSRGQFPCLFCLLRLGQFGKAENTRFAECPRFGLTDCPLVWLMWLWWECRGGCVSLVVLGAASWESLVMVLVKFLLDPWVCAHSVPLQRTYLFVFCNWLLGATLQLYKYLSTALHPLMILS